MSSGSRKGGSAGQEDVGLDHRAEVPAGKYLTFFLANEEYGIHILKVQEIISLVDVTPLPRAPEFLRGVINLRGHIVPVIDLALKFGMDSVRRSSETCLIVVKTGGIERAILVDRVSEVTDVACDDIEKMPPLGGGVDSGHIVGIAKSGGKVKLLLDIDRALSFDGCLDIGPQEAEGPGKASGPDAADAAA